MATYSFEELLGVGGFGEVYLGWRTGPRGVSVRVAVKVLRADLANPAPLIARLRDEAAMLATLDHPAVVRVIDLIQVADRWALVTEYIDGIDLARLLDPVYRLPERAIAELCGKVGGALTALHAVHLVHRDLKPSNVRISRYGEVKLLDFGIARSEELPRFARTQTGKMPFTLGYISPEAFTDGIQGPEADIFALGVTLYRALCGAKWYGLPLMEQASICASEDRYEAFAAERLAELQGVDDALIDLVAACVAYDPRRRPTAAQVEAHAEALAAALPGASLVQWARERSGWDVPQGRGGLSGWVLREDGARPPLLPAPDQARPSAWWWPAAAFVVGMWMLCLAFIAFVALAESSPR